MILGQRQKDKEKVGEVNSKAEKQTGNETFIAFCLEIFYNAITIIFKSDPIGFFYQIMAGSAGFSF